MKNACAEIIENRPMSAEIYAMTLKTDLARVVHCGQFLQVEIMNFFLRRPISVCEVLDENHLKLVYKVVGDGTKALSKLPEKAMLNVFGPLGNGFPVKECPVVLVGGGVGVPPLVETAKQYRRLHQQVTVVLGFNTKDDAILIDSFTNLECDVRIATMDGSLGIKGTVVDAIDQEHISTDYVCACGPLPMLKALQAICKDGCLSLESRMACGLGACNGCVIKDAKGESKRICKEGPVFEMHEVIL